MIKVVYFQNQKSVGLKDIHNQNIREHLRGYTDDAHRCCDTLVCPDKDCVDNGHITLALSVESPLPFSTLVDPCHAEFEKLVREHLHPFLGVDS